MASRLKIQKRLLEPVAQATGANYMTEAIFITGKGTWQETRARDGSERVIMRRKQLSRGEVAYGLYAVGCGLLLDLANPGVMPSPAATKVVVKAIPRRSPTAEARSATLILADALCLGCALYVENQGKETVGFDRARELLAEVFPAPPAVERGRDRIQARLEAALPRPDYPIKPDMQLILSTEAVLGAVEALGVRGLDLGSFVGAGLLQATPLQVHWQFSMGTAARYVAAGAECAVLRR